MWDYSRDGEIRCYLPTTEDGESYGCSYLIPKTDVKLSKPPVHGRHLHEHTHTHPDAADKTVTTESNAKEAEKKI